MTKGNFSTYLRYKLSKCRVLIVFYTVINFLSVLLPSMLFNKDMKELAEYVSVADSGLVYGTTWEFSLQILVLMIPLNIIIITISTVKSLSPHILSSHLKLHLPYLSSCSFVF